MMIWYDDVIWRCDMMMWYDDSVDPCIKNILNFGSWAKFPGKKGSWTVRVSHFSKFLTDDMIWWCDMMIWYDAMDMMMWYDDSVDSCRKNILNFGSWGKFPGKKGSWTVRLSHFSKFFTDDMIWWCDMMIWYNDMIWWCDVMIVLTRVGKIFWIFGLGANFQEKRVHEQWDIVIFSPSNFS